MILLSAAVVAGPVGDVKDWIVIGVLLLLTAGIGLDQERQAQSSMSALRSMLLFRARVRRGGHEVDVDGRSSYRATSCCCGRVTGSPPTAGWWLPAACPSRSRR